MSKFDDILAELPNLTSVQMKELQKRISFLVPKSTDEDKNEVMFFNSLYEYYTKSKSQYAYTSYKKQKSYKTFKEKFSVVENFLDKSFVDVTTIKRKFIYNFFAKLLIDRMTQTETECTIWLIACSIDRIPKLFDEALPGYAACGLANMIFKEF